jgi:hypothetical protein
VLLAACAAPQADRTSPAAPTTPLRLRDFVVGPHLAGFGWAPFRIPARSELDAAAATGALRWEQRQGLISVQALRGSDVGSVQVHFRDEDGESWPDAGSVLAIAVRPAFAADGDGSALLAVLGVRAGELRALSRYGSVLVWQTNVPGLLLAMPATDGLVRDELPAAPFELLRLHAPEAFLAQESLTTWQQLQEWSASGQLDRLLLHGDSLDVARRCGLAARVDALLHVGLAARADAEAPWRQLTAAWRLAERFGTAASGFDQPWCDGLQRRAAAHVAELHAAARDGYSRGAAIESAWLERLAAEVDRLTMHPAARTDRGEAVADVLEVLGAAAQQVVAAAAQGGFRPEQPPELEHTSGLTQAQVETVAFRYWSKEFEAHRRVITAAIVAQREAELQREAALREAELQRVAAQREAAAAAASAHASRGMLACAAAAWASIAERPTVARPLLELWRTQERDVGATAMLQLLARLLPFVPATDPDARRLYAALREVLDRSPLTNELRWILGTDIEVATFAALTDAEPVVPLLHALEDELRDEVRVDHQMTTEEREVLVPNPAFEQWRDQVARREGDVDLVDQAFRTKVGIAPNDPGFDTWLRLNPNARELVEPLLELHREAVASAWYARSTRPPEQIAARVRSERAVRTVRQNWNGFAARTLGLMAGEVFVTERVEHTIRSTDNVLEAESEFGAELASRRVENQVARAALAELDRLTTAALPALVRKFLVARAGHYLAAGRRNGWTEAELAAEAASLARWLDLPAGTLDDWQAVASPPVSFAAALATQTAQGGALRQVSSCVPVLPPLERLELLCELSGAWTSTDLGDSYRVRMSPSLRYVVARDDRGEAMAVDLQQRAELHGEDAERLWRESIDPARRFAPVVWLREVPEPLPEPQLLQGLLPTSDPQGSFLQFSAVPRYRVQSGLREDLPPLQGQLTDRGLLPGGGREDVRVTTLDPGGEIRNGGTLLLGRLAWTLSRIEGDEPAIDLWDSLDGRRLFRFAPAQELLILESLGVVVSLHWERRASDDEEVRTLRAWGLPGGR